MRYAIKFIAANALLTWTIAALAGSVQVLVVDKDGKPTPDAVVVLAVANKAVQPKTPLPTLVTIAQEKMQFIPAVTLLPVGGKARFVNNDAWDHHIKAGPSGAAQFANKADFFELRLEGKGDNKPAKAVDVALDKPGAVGAVLLGCFIHGSMRGNIYVSDSPWAVKTGADGVANFEEVPDGAAQVRVWQADQLIDLAPQAITVSAAPLKVKAQLQVNPRRARVTTPSAYY